MKKIVLSLIVLLVSTFAFASCDYFDVTNDCNGNSTTINARNDAVTMDIHANWKQGTISYKFQSGSEKLDMDVSAPNANQIAVSLKYKNKMASFVANLDQGDISSADADALITLFASIDPTFLENIQTLIQGISGETTNIQEIKDIAQSLFTQNEPRNILKIIIALIRIGKIIYCGIHCWGVSWSCFFNCVL
jgi:hypothetical protein